MNEELIQDEISLDDENVEVVAPTTDESDTEEEIVDEEQIEDEEPVLEENKDEDVADDELDNEENDNSTLSKEEKAIIKYKKENKVLKEKIKAREQQDFENKLESVEQSRFEELVADGTSEKEAKRIAQDEREKFELNYNLQSIKIRNLEEKYPGISTYKNELIELKEKYPDFNYDELYEAKFKKKSAYDDKTRIEALARANRNEVESKTLTKAKSTSTKTVELSPVDESAYKVWSNQTGNKGRTRKEFLKILNS